MPETQPIDITTIQQTSETQARRQIDERHVSDLAEAMKSGSTLDPVDLFMDGGRCWIGDGHHRIAAAVQNGETQISARLHSGGKDAATLHAAAANATHGLKRNNDDKRRAIRMALSVKPDWSDRALANHCAVDHKTVASVRQLTGEFPQSTPTGAIKNADSGLRVGSDGRTTNTANIGRKQDDGEPEIPASDNDDWMRDDPIADQTPTPDYAPPPNTKPVKNGSEQLPDKTRKEAIKHVAKLTNLLAKTAIYQKVLPHLNAITDVLSGRKGGRS